MTYHRNIQRLEKNAQKSTKRYAIVDCAATSGDQAILSRIHSGPPQETRLTGESAWTADHRAPCLLQLTDDPDLEKWLLETGWGHGWGVFYPNGMRLEQNTDASGLPHRMRLDGRRSQVFDKAFRRDGLNRVTRVSDGEHNVTYHYDKEGRLLKTRGGRCVHTWGDGGVYDCRLDHRPYERCVVVTDSLGHHTTCTCDNDRLPVTVRDSAGAATTYEYDEVGRVICVTDPLERATRYTYDAAGNVVEIHRPDQNRLQIAYDATHRPVQMCDANGKLWEQRFDERGRLIEKIKIDPLKASTRGWPRQLVAWVASQREEQLSKR